MSLNPFDAIEKVINEHGSAVILKERLGLAADQYSALERKVTKLEVKSKELETENRSLHAQLQQREAQIHALEVAAQQERTDDRSDIEQKILIVLSSSGGPEASQIARHFSIGEQVARFHLSELHNAKLVYPQGYIKGDAKWHLAQEGRRYLVTRGLIT